MKRSHKKKVHKDPSSASDWAKVQAQPDRENDPATHRGRDVGSDGEAKTPAEPVPAAGAPKGRGRHPADCQCPIHKDGGTRKKPKSDPFGGMFVKGKRGYKIHPRLSRVAALAPMMLVGAAGATFFDVLIPYEQENVEGCQEMFEAWMDELGLEFGPGWQYGALCLYTIAMGIRNAETLTPEMKEAMKAAKEAQRQAMRAEAMKRAQAAQKAAEHKNGVAPNAAPEQAAPAAEAQA